MHDVQLTEPSHELLFLAALGVEQPPCVIETLIVVEQVGWVAIGFGREDRHM